MAYQPKKKPTNIIREPKEIISKECSSCGKEFVNRTTSFYKSASALYKGNDGRVPICKSCSNKLFDEYFKLYDKDVHRAMRMVCMKLDLYYNGSILDSVTTSKDGGSNEKIVGSYCARLNMAQYKKYGDFTFDDTLREENINSITTYEELDRLDSEEISELAEFWGLGFEALEYRQLQKEYDDWMDRNIINCKSKEQLIESICILQVQMKRCLINEDMDGYTKLSKVYADTLKQAHLSPIQIDKEEENSELPLGELIKKIEMKQPIIDIPEYSEFRKIFIFIIGHLSKMWGKKGSTPVTKEYDKLIKLYGVNEDLNEVPSEEFYNSVMDG